MKLSIILMSLVTLSTAQTTSEDYLRQATAHLDKLSALRRPPHTEYEHLLSATSDRELTERIQDSEDVLINTDTMRRIDELASQAYKLYRDPQYMALMQERIKRGSGSGDFISGIANKVINGVVGAAGGLSSGLSSGSAGLSGGSSGSQTYDSYGHPVQPYGEKSFSLWDFKKAIINTLVQALKAIAGGALAFKGQLIKGGGFLVQTGGRVISSAGEAAASLGTQIASSAVISQPNPSYGTPGYTYTAPAGQDFAYDGPPPSQENTYTQHNVFHHYGAPSDEDGGKMPSGLLLVKPENQQENSQYSEQPPGGQPSVSSALEESFGGDPRSNNKAITKIVGLVTGTSVPPQNQQLDVSYLPAEHKDQGVSSHQDNSQQLSHNNGHQLQQTRPDNTISIQQQNLQEISTRNPQLAFQQIQALLNPHLIAPTNPAQAFNDELLNYPEAGTYESLKIPILDRQNSLESMHPSVMAVPAMYPHFGSWQRSTTIPRRRKYNLNKKQVRRAIDHWIKGTRMYRI